MEENQEILVDYDVTSEIAGHQPNKGVRVIEAAKDIFKHVNENKSGQSTFVSFSDSGHRFQRFNIGRYRKF